MRGELHAQLAVQLGLLRQAHERRGCVQHPGAQLHVPLTGAARRALMGGALVLSASVGWGVLSGPSPVTVEEVTDRVDAVSARETRREPPARAASGPPGPAASPREAVAVEAVARDAGVVEAVAREVVEVVDVDTVDSSAAAPAPSLVRYTPRTRAERVDVWLRFPALDVKDQLALQDQLPADPAGPAVELSGHRLRLRGQVPAGSIFWVSQELGFLGAGAELDEPDLERAGELRAIFVEQADDGSVRVRSSKPLTP